MMSMKRSSADRNVRKGWEGDFLSLAVVAPSHFWVKERKVFPEEKKVAYLRWLTRSISGSSSTTSIPLLRRYSTISPRNRQRKLLNATHEVSKSSGFDQ